MNLPGGVGFFGKLPGMGDFVQRRLPSAFVSAWDAAFEAAVNAARTEFGDAWRAAWMTAPAWRFALMPGVCGAPAWVGVTGPSVDRVGRGFPMVLACPLTEADVFVRIVRGGAGWFDALEHVWGGAETTPAAELFDVAVSALLSPSDWLAEGASSHPAPIDWTQASAWRMRWQGASEDRQLAMWLDACMSVEDGCLWWTRGGGRVSPDALLTRGLPQPQAYAAFLDSTQATGHWRSSGVFKATTMPAVSVPTPVGDAASATFPDDLDDVLCDLLPTVQPNFDTSDITIPGAMPKTAAIDKPVLSPSPALAESVVAGVVLQHIGAITALAADNGLRDPRRQAAALVGQAVATCGSLADLRARVLALHPSLREHAEDLINPVPEDGAVIAAHVADGQAALLRVGAASAWHWRRGQLRPLFDGACAPPPDQADTARPDDLTAVLSDVRVLAMPGLGAFGELRCDEMTCLVAPGDRLLLLATDTLLAIPAASLAEALASGTEEEARGRIAATAGLGMDRAQWPLAVIEVGTT